MTAALPSPTLSGDATACLAGSDWRLSALEVNDGLLVKTWYSLIPAGASGPVDAAIPTVRVYAESVQRLGFCAGAGASPAGPDASAWAIDGRDRATMVALTQADDPGLANAGLGWLFVPPVTGTGVARDWRPGHYVFEVGSGSRAADRRWFGVEIAAVGSGLTSSKASTMTAETTTSIAR
jgi:hypothetical protein